VAVILRIVKVIDSSEKEASTEGEDSRAEGEEDSAHGEDTRNLLSEKDGWITAVIKVVIAIAIFRRLSTGVSGHINVSMGSFLANQNVEFLQN
jgi:hypothetical protein